jgi:hypothetical protein
MVMEVGLFFEQALEQPVIRITKLIFLVEESFDNLFLKFCKLG